MKWVLSLSLLFNIQSINAQQVVKDLTAQKFKVVSTTNGSKPCPSMTQTQRNAIASPTTGDCVNNTTTSKLNVYNGSLWKAAGGGVDAWATSTIYAVDDLVIQTNKIYKCLTAHTSGTFATDLAATKWVEVSATENLTGPITSVGAVTSVAAQTGTGSTFVMNTSPTLVTPAIGAATGTSLALAGNLTAYNYDKDNMLVNGNIENPLSSEWTCTVGTCTRTTTSGEFSKDTAALKIALSSQAMNVSQSVSTPSGIQAQGVVGTIYRVPSAVTDFQVCSVVGVTEQTCVPSANLIFDGAYHSIEIPVVMTAGSTVGIKFKTTATYTQNIFIDGAYIKQGIGLTNLTLDNFYTATISAAGVVSAESADFINGNCVTTTGHTCTFSTGKFTVTPNCGCNYENLGSTSDASCAVSSYSGTSSIVIEAYYNSTRTTGRVQLWCMKQGNDYLAASASVYSQANLNFDAITTTSTLTAVTTPPTKGTVGVDKMQYSKDGGVLDILWTYSQTAAGSAGSGVYLITLPNSYVIDTNRAHLSTTLGSVLGGGNLSNTSGGVADITQHAEVFAYDSTHLAIKLLSQAAGTNTQTIWSDTSGINFGATNLKVAINARVPIVGWSNLSSNSAALIGFTNVPGQSSLVDKFLFDFGTTDTNTACTASPCSWLNQIGTQVSSVTRSATGTYAANFSRTYSKLFCGGVSQNGSATASLLRKMSCTSCNSIAVLTQNTAGTLTDANPMIECTGTY